MDVIFSVKPDKQYIDVIGKCRALNFKTDDYKVTLYINPRAPYLYIDTTKKIYRANSKELFAFLKDVNLDIVYQELNKDTGVFIRGVWVKLKSSNTLFYIPVNRKFDEIEGVDYAPDNMSDPILIGHGSQLTKLQNTKRLANIYKMYAIYTKAILKDDFDNDSILVDNSHSIKEDELNKRLYMNDNNIMYKITKKGNKSIYQLIVPSQTIKDSLLSYVAVISKNFGDVMKSIENMSVIPNYYDDISSFRSNESQLIFLNRESISEWVTNKKSSKTRNKTFDVLQPQIMGEPYFYNNVNILGNKILMMQNTRSINDSIDIIYNWIKYKINYVTSEEIPNDQKPEEGSITYALYNEFGFKEGDENSKYHIIDYEMSDESLPVYGAVLIK